LEQQLTKASRFIFKTVDMKHLTSEAHDACQHIGVKPESLVNKNLESFQAREGEAVELG